MTKKNETNKKEFLSIVNEFIHRDGIDNLIEWLQNSDFFEAPASTRFHGNYEGGLCEHCLNVYYSLIKELKCNELADVYGYETAAIVSLFHDLCKVNFYKVDFKNQKNEQGVWETVPYYTIDEKFPCGDHADKSIIILQNYIKLLPEEILAIRAHMGGFDTTVKGGSYMIGNIFGKSKLALMLHIADLEATYLMENKDG